MKFSFHRFGHWLSQRTTTVTAWPTVTLSGLHDATADGMNEAS